MGCSHCWGFHGIIGTWIEDPGKLEGHGEISSYSFYFVGGRVGQEFIRNGL